MRTATALRAEVKVRRLKAKDIVCTIITKLALDEPPSDDLMDSLIQYVYTELFLENIDGFREGDKS